MVCYLSSSLTNKVCLPSFPMSSASSMVPESSDRNQSTSNQTLRQHIAFTLPGRGLPKVSGSRRVRRPEQEARRANTAMGSQERPVRRPRLGGGVGARGKEMWQDH